MSGNRKGEWEVLIGEQKKTWEDLLEAYGEIYKILSGQGIPMDDHYDDIEDAAEALRVMKDKAIVFLRDWQQEEMG
jgi:hypothetical protein